jgi:uncharacterized SAM-binding protein YcdF (DUF218 family)
MEPSIGTAEWYCGPRWSDRRGDINSARRSWLERCSRAFVTGGNGALIGDGPIEADFAIPFFESLGVSKDRIIVERRARNTVENATFTKQLVAPERGERWLLVTSAAHMPRAIGVFREAGFPVEAYPVDYQTVGWEDLLKLPGSLMGRVRLTAERISYEHTACHP